MNQAEIRESIRNSADRPVRICMDDGRTYLVSHPDFALATSDAILLVSGPNHNFGSSFVIRYDHHVSRVEVLPHPGKDGLNRASVASTFRRMSPTEIIEAIKGLPPEQRADVVRFTQQYEPVKELSPEELGELAERLLAASTPEEAEAIKKAMINGFYGTVVDA